MFFGAVTASTTVGREPATITKVDEFAEDGRRVVGEWVRAPGCVRHDLAILYLHGGGYISTAAAHYRGITARLSALTGVAVFVVDYRLAPEHPYPAALSDAVAAYRRMIGDGTKVVVIGDSAGAHLAVGLTVNAILGGGTVPRAQVLFSPLLDVSCRGAATLDRTSRDPMMSPGFARRCAEALGIDLDTTDPRVAILNAGSEILRWFPPTLSITGGTECFRDDARLLHNRLITLGIDSQTHTAEGHVHDFVLFTRTRTARVALRAAADFVVGQGDSAHLVRPAIVDEPRRM
jgi:acetyl esterase/lipase